MGIIGAGAVYLVGQPAPPKSETYSATSTLVVKEDEVVSSVLLYSYVAVETSQIVEQVVEDLGDIYDDGAPIETINTTVTVFAEPEIGTLTLGISDQPSEQTAGAVLERYGHYIIKYATDRRTEERDEQLSGLDTQASNLNAKIGSLTRELDDLTRSQSEEDRILGVPVDRLKQAQLTTMVGSLSQITDQINDLRSQSEEDLTPLRAVGLPTTVADPAAGQPLDYQQRMMLGIGLGLLLGLGLAFTLHRFDTRLYDRRDGEAAFGLPVLAEIPKVRWLKRRKNQLITRIDPSAPAAEAYRLLRSGVARAASDKAAADPALAGLGSAVLITSVSSGAGKTSTAANLAVASVDAGKSVLLIAADLRRPKIGNYFEVERGPGLTEAVQEIGPDGQVPDFDSYIHDTAIDGISLMLSGGPVPNPGETLAKTGPLIEEARKRFPVVIIDMPPMAVGNDYNEAVGLVDLVVLVARAGRTTIEEGHWAEETNARLDAPACGVALVGARSDLEQLGSRGGLLGRLFKRDRYRSALKEGAAAPAIEEDASVPAAPLGPTTPAATEIPDPKAPFPPPTAVPSPDVAAAATAPAADLAPAAPAEPLNFPPPTEPARHATPQTAPAAPAAAAPNNAAASAGPGVPAVTVLVPSPSSPDQPAGEPDSTDPLPIQREEAALPDISDIPFGTDGRSQNSDNGTADGRTKGDANGRSNGSTADPATAASNTNGDSAAPTELIDLDDDFIMDDLEDEDEHSGVTPKTHASGPSTGPGRQLSA